MQAQTLSSPGTASPARRGSLRSWCVSAAIAGLTLAAAPDVAAQNGTVTIAYDQFGVPHVDGTTDKAAFFGAGYAAARDRMFQMNFVRLRMRGRLAEFFGPGSRAFDPLGNQLFDRNGAPIGEDTYVDSDKAVRTLGYGRYGDYATGIMRNAAPGTRERDAYEMLESYADGVNAYIQQAINPNPTFPDQLNDAGSGLSDLFRVYAIPIAPDWTPEDCVLAWLDLATNYQSGVAGDLKNQRRLPQGSQVTEADRLDALFQFGKVVDHAAVVQNGDIPNKAAIDAYASSLGVTQYVRADRLTSPYAPLFSEGIAVRGGLLSNEPPATRPNSVLWGGPRIPVGLPNMLFEWYFRSPNFVARGAGVPGSPNLLVGFNGQPAAHKGRFAGVAWSVTAQPNDITDLYEIEIDDGDTGYTYAGATRPWEAAATEVIQIADLHNPGQFLMPVQVEYRETVWGPLVTDLIGATPAEGDFAVAMSTIWKGAPAPAAIDSSIGHIQMFRANGVGQLVDAVTEYYRVPCTNMVMADSSGSVAYTATGDVPVRAANDNWAGILPRNGSDPSKAWQEFVRPEFRPQVINPTRDFVYSGNHLPIGSDYGLIAYYRGLGEGTRAYRLRKLMENGAAAGTLDVASIQDLSMDRVRDDALEITVYANLAQSLGVVHYSPNVKLLLDQLVSWHPALGGGSGELDGQSVGAVLAAFLRPALRAEAGPNDGCSPAGGYSCLPAVASADEVRLALRYGGRGEGPMNMLHEIGRGLGLNPVRLPAANEARVLGEWLEQAECWAHTYLEDSSVVQPCNPVNWQLVLTDLPGVYDQKFLTAGSVTQLGIPRVQRVRFAGSLPAWYRVGFAAPVDVDPLDILPNPPSRHIDYPVDPVTVEASTMCDVPNVSFNQFCAMGSNPDLCETVLGGGQSEKPASAHHTDQMQLQALGMTKPAPISVAGVQALTQGMMSFTLIVP